MNRDRRPWRSLAFALSLAALTGAIVWLGLGERSLAAERHQPVTSLSESYLYRFDAIAQTFVTIPLAAGSQPIGLAMTGTLPTHVWFTEYGRNRIGHIVYTGTADYELIEYPITSTGDSGPYRLTIDGSDIWFTERHANRVGRLNATTGVIDEFYGHGLSPNSGLSDIKVGWSWIWIGSEWSKRLVRLTVTSAQLYTFTEIIDTRPSPTFTVAPHSLAVDDANNLIFLTVPYAAFDNSKFAQYDPFSNLFTWATGLPSNSAPMEVVVVPNELWVSNRSRNTLDQLQLGTLTIANSNGPITHPMGLAAESARVFWATQQTASGAIARLIYTQTQPATINSYPIPTPGLELTGIAVAADHGVWFAAYRPVTQYLPIVVK
jgi:streptogramin lyase